MALARSKSADHPPPPPPTLQLHVKFLIVFFSNELWAHTLPTICHAMYVCLCAAYMCVYLCQLSCAGRGREGFKAHTQQTI